MTAGDGSVGAGFGIGNAFTLVGLEVAVTSFSTLRSGWGNRMGVDFKLHRILPGDVAVAFGWESTLLRGRPDGLRSRYGVASRWFQLRPDSRTPLSAFILSAGVGDNRFVRPADWVDGTEYGVFGSVALRLIEPVNFIADWTGQDLALALSVTPLRSHRLVITAGAVDLTGSAGDGARLVLSAGYGGAFLPPPSDPSPDTRAP